VAARNDLAKEFESVRRGGRTVSTDDVRQRIGDVVDDKGLELVKEYYRVENGFAGALFDELGEHDDRRFTSDDLLAASLLDVRFTPTAVRRLVVDGKADSLLAEITNDPEVALWNTDLGRHSPAWHLWDVLTQSGNGIGPTRASKLLARKRPHLFPVLDAVIIEALALGTTDRWSVLAVALDEETRARVETLRPGASSRGSPSTLRLLDVATWMRFSRSRRATRVRRELGFDPA
jgi:hypothetical protein